MTVVKIQSGHLENSKEIKVSQVLSMPKHNILSMTEFRNTKAIHLVFLLKKDKFTHRPQFYSAILKIIF